MTDHFCLLGFLVLASKVRKPEEEETIMQILEKHFKCSISLDRLFTCELIFYNLLCNLLIFLCTYYISLEICYSK